jgi:hypothetical protein
MAYDSDSSNVADVAETTEHQDDEHEDEDEYSTKDPGEERSAREVTCGVAAIAGSFCFRHGSLA